MFNLTYIRYHRDKKISSKDKVKVVCLKWKSGLRNVFITDILLKLIDWSLYSNLLLKVKRVSHP